MFILTTLYTNLMPIFLFKLLFLFLTREVHFDYLCDFLIQKAYYGIR